MDYHMPPSGAYYIRFACANCACMTPVYQPQYESCHGLGAAHTLKEMKQHPIIRTSFRLFISEVFGLSVEADPCRFRLADSTDPPHAICDGSA